jgi:hypothetical protein
MKVRTLTRLSSNTACHKWLTGKRKLKKPLNTSGDADGTGDGPGDDSGDGNGEMSKRISVLP